MKKLLLLTLLSVRILNAQHCDSVLHWRLWGSAWRLNTGEIFKYNAADSLTEFQMRWNDGGNVPLSAGTKIVNIYNANNLLVERRGLTLQSTGWTTTGRMVCAYDGNNNRIADSSQTWTGSGWQNAELNTYGYDNNHNLVYRSLQWYTNGVWINDKQEFYAYDADNRLTSYRDQRWNNGAWHDDEQYFVTYDSDGRKSKVTSLCTKSGITDTVGDQIYSYTVTGKIAQYREREKINGAWQNSSRDTYTYDASGNNTFIKRETCDGTNGWGRYMDISYAYNSDNLCVQSSIIPYSGPNIAGRRWTNTYDSHNRLLIEMLEMNDTGSWQKYDSSRYYYTDATTLAREVKEEDEFNVYPNPSTGSFTIQLQPESKADIVVYDAMGNVCLRKEICASFCCIHSELSKGIYLVEMCVDDKRTYRRWVVE